MKKRLCWLLISFFSLGTGAMLYGLYRQDTYIGKAIGRYLHIQLPAKGLFSGLASWYLPDFLWMFSMICALFAVVKSEGASVLVWVGIAFFCGVLWELLQLCNVVSGTGDFWDILMYSIAALLATIIKSNKKGE